MGSTLNLGNLTGTFGATTHLSSAFRFGLLVGAYALGMLVGKAALAIGVL